MIWQKFKGLFFGFLVLSFLMGTDFLQFPTADAKVAKTQNRKSKKTRSREKRKPASVQKTKKEIRIPGAGPIPKKIWLSWYKKDLSQEMCEDQSYLRTCFPMSQKKCEKIMKREISTCWGREMIYWRQAKIRPRQEGVIMGYRLGQCAGTSIETKYKKHKFKNNQCKYMDEWMGK